MTIEVKRRAMQTLQLAREWYGTWKAGYEIVGRCLGVHPHTVQVWHSLWKRGEL